MKIGVLLRKGLLVLVRHGRSVWNDQNRFTGWVDIPLSPEGIEQALKTGDILANQNFDVCFTSTLVRAQMTLFLLLSRSKVAGTPCIMHKDAFREVFSSEVQKTLLPVEVSAALNERMYGELQGQNKEDVLKLFGPERFALWRRSYEGCPPDGESLEMTAGRAVPYFKEQIEPRILAGENVLVVAHGNSLRAIVMYLRGLTTEEVPLLEIATGDPLFFEWKNGWADRT